ncbi:hypothetical protein E2C01_094255 [Portunus trituberculatus]|uniref:Uncharacterized protein n=1 Tax=Portunus trituberculatus TaxID=210409 RepID=A0A5B7JPY4_PORTR|nr:hypothetical protein [Portunus trituberculatus]
MRGLGDFSLWLQISENQPKDFPISFGGWRESVVISGDWLARRRDEAVTPRGGKCFDGGGGGGGGQQQATREPDNQATHALHTSTMKARPYSHI